MFPNASCLYGHGQVLDAPFEPCAAAPERSDCAHITDETRRGWLDLQRTELTCLALRIAVEAAFDLRHFQRDRYGDSVALGRRRYHADNIARRLGPASEAYSQKHGTKQQSHSPDSRLIS